MFLTAKAAEEDAVFGSGVGADDYIRKPFGAAELRAKVATHLRREKRERVYALAFGDVQLDLAARELYVGEAPVALTKTEFDVCEFLARHPGQVFATRSSRACWAGARSDAATISVHVSNAREAEGGGRGADADRMGVGYKWIAWAEEEPGAPAGRGLPLSLVILRYFAYVRAAAVALALGTYLCSASSSARARCIRRTTATRRSRRRRRASCRATMRGRRRRRAVELPLGPVREGRRLRGRRCARARRTISRRAAFDGLAIAYGG